MNVLLFPNHSIHEPINPLLISVHRLVLYTVNDYFNALFMTELKERSQDEISIQKVGSNVKRVKIQLRRFK